MLGWFKKCTHTWMSWCGTDFCIDCGAQRAQPTATPTVEHRTTELPAWRGWHLASDDDGECYLWSYNNTRWDSPTLTADRVPEAEHSHGLYAVKDRESSNWRLHCAGRDVIGEVALSGRVVEGETGYRAEHCTIRRLILQRVPPERIALDVQARLEERYQCEVELALREESAYGLSSYGVFSSASSLSLTTQALWWQQQQQGMQNAFGQPSQAQQYALAQQAWYIPSGTFLLEHDYQHGVAEPIIRTERFSESLWLPGEAA